MLNDWQGALWYAAIGTAVAGGIVSLSAFFLRTRHSDDPESSRKAHILYLISYILMSISIFFMAFRGLVQ